jgi:hypothetical protein
MKFSRIFWRRPRPKLGCGATERRKKKKKKKTRMIKFILSIPKSDGCCEQ